MFLRHWREVASYSDIPLDPDFNEYLRVARLGFTRCYTARQAGRIIGYGLYFLAVNAHYRSSLQARQDLFYVEPMRGRAWIASALSRFADERLAADGAQVCYHHVKLAHPALGRVLERQGYKAVETIYARRLDQNPASSSVGTGSARGEEANNAHAAAPSHSEVH